MKKDKKKKKDSDRDALIKAICTYTGDSIAKVLPWVKRYLND